ncbi:MAG: aminotransferase class III-fold pyridoxal phosphate-dependent enzyme [Proteobacteria bacterium]|nr:aminotransferase class III-fold pyridoxal phosphate-dependent enzyme [Pseudomonadota bacterium]
MTTTRTETTVGQQLRDSRAIRDAIESIVAEVRSRSARITDVRGPIDGETESYQAFMDRAAQVRGRGLLYPYVGSGVGNGALVELADGSVKWDMICGIGVHFFGHSDPELIEAALLGAIDDTVKHGNLQSNTGAFTFAETLLTEASRASRLKHCFLSTGGAMANENALKVCFQKHAPASRVLAFKDCFMGRTVAMSQIGDEAAYRVGIPLNFLVDYIPFYDEIEARQIGEARCTECHNGPLLTNNEFHNTGPLSAPGELPDRGRIDGVREVLADPFNCLGLFNDDPEPSCAELRYVRTGVELIAATRTPSLRNLKNTAPFQHKGQTATLTAVLDHYNKAPLAMIGHNETTELNLRGWELRALEAFLHTLGAPIAADEKWLRPPEIYDTLMSSEKFATFTDAAAEIDPSASIGNP